MNYTFDELSIGQLYELIEKKKIDLNPSYQRNFIWSPINQKELIDTIIHGYPLPAFFIYEYPNGKLEMVDGQQRSKTIFRFIKGQINATKKNNNCSFSDIKQDEFLAYRLPVIRMSNLSAGDSLKEFYVLINKKGVHLNVAEVTKSEFHDTNFLKLANDVLTYQNLIELNLFSEATSKRMNDRAFIEELLGYLILGAAKDKKKAVTDIYEEDISDADVTEFKMKFQSIIDIIFELNKLFPISETRYKQKNDFYTLFSFIDTSSDVIDILRYQYRVLLILDRNDNDGRQFIRPSNDECAALKEYATNCITQSNSKKARDKRLEFFNLVLRNENEAANDTLTDVLNYLGLVYGDASINLKTVGKYNLLDVDPL